MADAVRYWSEEGGGHWVQWPAEPPGPGLYRAADDQWALDETGTLVQLITGIELVNQPEARPVPREKGGGALWRGPLR